MTTKERAEQIAKQLMSTGNYQVVISEKTSAIFPAKALLYLVENEPILCNELFDSLENNTTKVEGVNKPCKKYEIAGVKLPRFMLEKSIFDAISDGNVDKSRWVKDTTFLIEGKEFVVTNQWQGHEIEKNNNHRINDFAFLIYEFFQCRYFVNFNNGTIELCSLLKSNKMESNKLESSKDDLSLQQIFYGAPGTGKSHSVCEVTKNLPKEDVFRITFHPDSDYASFVGCYKPTETEGFRYGINGTNTVKMVDPDNGGAPLVEKKITYRFVPQAFINAYVRAYHTDSPVFLVIEEINRGNCAQIFGDMFQLLDRGDSGESDYAIKPDSDIQDYLSKVMADAHTDDEAIKQGVEMKLPANLFIWATMNTSDQSLFPIDSAFKRRWDWKYMPIDYEKEKWSIVTKGEPYSWSDFLKKMNNLVANATDSEDKMLGFYFAKAKNGIIDADTFVGKVVFYLWNDVFKDYGLPKEILNGVESKEFAFRNFFMVDGRANEDMVKRLLDNLGVAKPVETGSPVEDTEHQDEA